MAKINELFAYNQRKKCLACGWIGTTKRTHCHCGYSLESAAGGVTVGTKSKVLLIRDHKGEVIQNNLDSIPSKLDF